jgi:hypothetical protein
VAEELCRASGTAASDLAYATGLAAQMVGRSGWPSPISYEAVAQGGHRRTWSPVLGDSDGSNGWRTSSRRSGRVREVLRRTATSTPPFDALIERDELVRDETSDVIEKALANRT